MAAGDLKQSSVRQVAQVLTTVNLPTCDHFSSVVRRGPWGSRGRTAVRPTNNFPWLQTRGGRRQLRSATLSLATGGAFARTLNFSGAARGRSDMPL